MARVFIGMSAYNGEKYIDEAIESLLRQSFSDIHLFISDDASSDNTRNVCETYAKKDPRITYYRQEKNLGLFPQYEFLIKKADGEYFMWASQDDIWEKDFIKTCVENIETRSVDVAMTVMTDADSFGRSIRELPEMQILSGSPSVLQVSRYILQPEILGKGNLMHSLYKTDVIKKLWAIYPQKKEWGSDYIFSLALVSHFSIFVDPKVLVRKRLGGYSSAEAIKDDDKNAVKKIIITDPKNRMFPFGRFKQYFRGSMQALRGTPYRPLAAILLCARLPRSFFIYLKERNFKKFLPT